MQKKIYYDYVEKGCFLFIYFLFFIYSFFIHQIFLFLLLFLHFLLPPSSLLPPPPSFRAKNEKTDFERLEDLASSPITRSYYDTLIATTVEALFGYLAEDSGNNIT